ncbi:MAG: holo-ACP synthase [Polyangiaceae bacterium]
MVIGLGIDVASIPRIRAALARHGLRFWQRILTPAEQQDLDGIRGDRAVTLAGRFAAKEAFSKALGAPQDVWFQDVEVRRDASGLPRLSWTGAALARAEALGVARALVSITHDADVAAAVVVLEREA